MDWLVLVVPSSQSFLEWEPAALSSFLPWTLSDHGM